MVVINEFGALTLTGVTKDEAELLVEALRTLSGGKMKDQIIVPDKKNGETQEKNTTEIVLDTLKMLGGKKDGQEHNEAPAASPSGQRVTPDGTNYEDNGKDDLPF